MDVYSDWIDACDAVAKDAADAEGNTAATSYRDIDVTSGRQGPMGTSDVPLGDDHLDDLDAPGEADYGDE